MEKRPFPLFIIDSSRQHGRGQECDYLFCTAHDCEFVAKVELIEEKLYTETYDKNDVRTIYSDPRNGLRMKISVIQAGECDESRLRSLLRKALKEVLERRQSNVMGNELTDKDVLLFISAFLEQTKEHIAMNPNMAKDFSLHLKVFSKIIEDYSSKK